MNAKTIVYSLFLSLLILIAGCDSNLIGSDDQVKIRIQNSTEFEMENIIVSFPKKEVSYGDLAPGAQSDYIKVEKAYRYAYVESEVNGGKAYLVPIDYVGESTLNSGNYTYRLFIASENSDTIGEEPQYYLGIELKKN